MKAPLNFTFLYDYESFRKALKNLAINNPELFSELMTSLPKIPEYNERCNPYVSFYEKHVSHGIVKAKTHYTPVSDEDAIERFIERSTKIRAEGILHEQEFRKRMLFAIDPSVEEAIRNLRSNDAVKAIMFLLHNVTEDVRQKFWDGFLDPEELAKRAHANIIVRRIENDGMMKGNIGRYLIYTQKGDSEASQLKFTHQASCVYYLMFLIDRSQHEGFLLPLELGANKEQFMNLYHNVYDITQDKLSDRFKKLLFREEGKNLRVGRIKDVISDIHKRVDENFAEYDEDSSPYVMTAFRHLEIDPKRIVFESQEILSFEFKQSPPCHDYI